MSLASESHLVGVVDVNRLLADAQDLSVSVPEAWRTDHAMQLEQQVIAMLDHFAKGLYELDTTTISDERYAELLGWTRVIAALVQSYMFIRYRDSDCQPFSSLRARLLAAIEGFELGLPLNPARRPTPEEQLARLDAEFGRLSTVTRWSGVARFRG